MRRDRRERVVGDFGLETTSTQDIGFFDVVDIVACEVTAAGMAGEVGEVGNNATGVGVAGDETIGEVGGVASDVAGEVSKVEGEAIDEVGDVGSDVAGEAVAKGIATGVGVVEGEAIGEVDEVANVTVAGEGVSFSAFTCFVRTCS